MDIVDAGVLSDRFSSRPSVAPSRRYVPGDGMHISDLVVRVNAEMSDLYVADKAARERHWAKHPTHIACLKCMDGRAHLPSMTRTPMGLVKSFRAIGGKFEIHWPAFRQRLTNWAKRAVRAGARNILLVSYHYSASDPHLGCMGWRYDVAAARAHGERLAATISRVYGEQMDVIVTGMETDTDTLTLHGPRGDLSGDALIGLDEDEIRHRVRRAFPTLPERSVRDLIPFLAGNAARVRELADDPRDLTGLGHSERIIALGQDFNWLAQANLALIINDADTNLDEAVVTAAKIVAENLKDAREGDDAVLVTNIPWEEPGMDERSAREGSIDLMRFALGHVRERLPRLAASGRLHHLACVTFDPSKRLQVVEDSRSVGSA